MNQNINKNNLNKQNTIKKIIIKLTPYWLILYATITLYYGVTTALLKGPIEAIKPWTYFEEGKPQITILRYGVIGTIIALYAIPFYITAFGINTLKSWSWKLFKITAIMGIVGILSMCAWLTIGIVVIEVDPKTLAIPIRQLLLLIILYKIFPKKSDIDIINSSQKIVDQKKLACVTVCLIISVISLITWGKYEQIKTINEIKKVTTELKIKKQNNKPPTHEDFQVINIGISASSAQRLENGNTLIANYNGYIIEIDNNGNIVWSYGEKQGNNAMKTIKHATRLLNGNTLIADKNTKQVVEISPNKEIVWVWSDPEVGPEFAQRLKNGNTLITASDKIGGNTIVLEVLPTCIKTLCPSRDIIWYYDGGTNQKSNAFNQATRLDNGNTLIVSERLRGDGIIEINKEGKMVWQYGKGKSFTNAYRLEDNKTLIAQNDCNSCTEGYIFIVNQNGKIVWFLDDTKSVESQKEFEFVYPTKTESILAIANGHIFEIDKKTKKIIWAVK